MRKKVFYLSFLLLLLGGTVGNLSAQKTGSWIDYSAGFTQGVGSPDNPYIISNGAQLAFLASQINLGTVIFINAHYELGADIDLKDHYWVPIGNDELKFFAGTFDGKDFIISNLEVRPTYDSPYVGLFGYIKDAKVSKVHLEKLIMLTAGVTRMGGLVGVSKSSVVTECSVMGTISGADYIGGLIGQASDTEIKKCYAFCTIMTAYENTGGLIGSLEQGSKLSNCYSMGLVPGQRQVGGLIGFTKDSEVRNSYTASTVIAAKKNGIGGNDVGGIIGKADQGTKLSNCFARSIRIGGASDADASVHRVVGNFDPRGTLQKNYAREDMLISRSGKYDLVPDGEAALIGLDKPHGKSVPNDFEWCDEINEDGDWICSDPPIPHYQSEPVICITSSTEQIVVEYMPLRENMKTIELWDENFEPIPASKVSFKWSDTNLQQAIFKPTSAFKFEVGDVFHAIAYEFGKTASPYVRIVITPYEEGNGTKKNPFIIRTEPQLDAVRNSYTTPKYSNYKLVANLDMSTYKDGEGNLIEFKPIGTERKPFPGSFEGTGHVIYNLEVKGGAEDDLQGLFGYVLSNDTIKNLGLENVSITGRNQVGALAGKLSAVVENVYTTGTVSATGNNVGGLLGELMVGKSVLNCYSTCLVKGNNYIGGLIGNTSSTVSDCYATGPVLGNDYLGGLLGMVASANVIYCYSAGLVAGPSVAPRKGGLIGAAAGAVQVSSCFDKNTSGVSADKGIGSSGGATLQGAAVPQTTLYLASMDASESFPTLPGRPTKFSFLPDNYPQLKAFAEPKFGNKVAKENTKYCSALSVVPVRFFNSENANAVKTSFNAPSEYVIGGEKKVITNASTVPGGKIISALNTGEADTLKITVEAFELPDSDPVINIKERSRNICFIPDQQTPTCIATRTAGNLNTNGWSKEDIEFTLSTFEADANNWIGGPVRYQYYSAKTEGEWMDLPENPHVFTEETKDLVQYRALNNAKTGNPTADEIVNIDKTAPIISSVNVVGDGASPEKPAQGNAKIAVKFKDELSKVASVQWEIGSPKFSEGSIAGLDGLTPDAQGFLTAEVLLPLPEEPVAGNYPVAFTVIDKADNSKNSNDDFPLDIYVVVPGVDPNDYTLDGVTVDGDSAEQDKNKDKKNWWYTKVCVVADSARVILTPSTLNGEQWAAPVDTLITGLKYGDENIIAISIPSKDGKMVDGVFVPTIVQTFYIKICREIPIAHLMSLKVDGEEIPLKVGEYKYTLYVYPTDKVKSLPTEQDWVVAEYELAKPVGAVTTCVPPPPSHKFENLKLGWNTIKIDVTTKKVGVKDSTNYYEIRVYRYAKPDVVDDVDIDDFDDDPYDKDDKPNYPDDLNPYYDGDVTDENGRFITIFALRTACDLKEKDKPHTLTVNAPSNEPNATVTFYSLDDKGKPILSTKKETNSYEFKIAKYYNLRVTVDPKNGNYPRNYNFHIVKRFEVTKGNYDKEVFYYRKGWDDVITVINNPVNNGGYLFDSYEWRITNDKGDLLPGGKLDDKKKSYLGGEDGKWYVARLTGTHTDLGGKETSFSQVPTCPCLINLTGQQASILAYPSILSVGESVTISVENIPDVDLEGANVSIVSSMGNKVKKVFLTGSKTSVEMPSTPGVYLLKVSTKSIVKEFKVVLK